MAVDCGVVLLLSAWSAGVGRSIDMDLWHEMATAREALRAGYVSAVDVFSYTPTISPVVHHEWGAGLLGYAILQACGTPGIAVLNSLLACTAVFLSLACAFRHGAAPELAALTSCLAVSMLHFAFAPIRAHAYGLACMSALLYVLQRGTTRARWLSAALPITLLWVNLHASFVIGFALVAAASLDARIQHRPVRP